MKFIVLILSVFLSHAIAHQSNNQQDWLRLTKQDMQVEFSVSVIDIDKTVKHLKSKNFDVTYVNNKTGLIHVLINQDDFPILKSLYPQLSVKNSRYINMGPDQQYKSYDEIKEIILKI
jgi:hypothetical protein